MAETEPGPEQTEKVSDSVGQAAPPTAAAVADREETRIGVNAGHTVGQALSVADKRLS